MVNHSSILFCNQRAVTFRVAEKMSPYFLHTTFYLYILFGIVGVTINPLVIYVIQKTKQTKNQSILLIQYLTILDILTGLSSISQAYQILHYKEISCAAIISIYVVDVTTAYTSSYMAGMVGLDRFLRIQYLARYKEVFTRKRFYLSLFGIAILVLFQSILTLSLNVTHYPRYAGPYALPVNIFFVILAFLLHLLSIRKLTIHQKANRRLSKSSRNITKIALVYFCTFLIFQGYLLSFQMLFVIINGKLKLEAEAFIIVTKFLMLTTQASINSIAFLRINRKARRFLKKMLHIRPPKKTNTENTRNKQSGNTEN